MKHKHPQTEDAGRKVQIRTGMKAGTDYAILLPVELVSTGDTTATETTTTAS
jgi:hypothetical protein